MSLDAYNLERNIFRDIHRVVCLKFTKVSGEYLASIFRVEEWTDQDTSVKFEATYSSETSIEFQMITQRYITEDSTLHNHLCENLKPYT